MRKVSELEGMTVIDVKDGTKIGQVNEIIVSPEDLRLLGLVVRSGGMLDTKERVIEAGDIRAIGPDAITVESADAAHRSEAATEEFRQVRTGGRRLSGKKVVTDTGAELGTVSDAVIDEDSGRVSALVVDGGGLLGASSESVHVDRIQSVGADVIVARAGDTSKTPA